MSTEPLADDALVIRGGLMETVTLRNSLEICRARAGFYGLSFWGDNELVFEETCLEARLRNEHVRVSTVGRLRTLGLEPYRTGRIPHLTVRFEVSPSDEELEDLAAAFDPDIPNPHPVE